MRAAVYKGDRRIEVEDVETPKPGPGQVLMRIKYAGICGSDVHRFQFGMLRPGVVLGHEYCGTVAGLGEGVTGWAIGDRIVGGGGVAPGSQPTRATSSPRYTAKQAGFNPAITYGGFAEYICLDAWRPLKTPDDVPDEGAVLAEPCSVAVHAVRRSQLKVGDSVAILGAGPIGLLTQQVCRAAGARQILVSEPSDARRRAATELGADLVIDPRGEDVVARFLAETGGLGPDVVFDCAGARGTLQQSLDVARRGGQAVVVSLNWEQDQVMPVDWVGREVNLQAAYGSLPEDWSISLYLMSRGDVRHGPMVSEAGIIPLEGAQAAFESLMRPGEQVQVVIAP